MSERNPTIEHRTASLAIPSPRSAALVSGALVTLFAALTFVGANIVIPLQPVPITMQTLFVLLAGALIGARRGALSQGLYVGAGALGLPIYAGGLSGWGIVAGPTGGYLAAFVVTPFVVAALLPRAQTLLTQAGVFTLATLVIFAMGVTHLALFYTHDLSAAITVGLVPFLPGAAFKVVAAVSIYRSWTGLRSRRTAS